MVNLTLHRNRIGDNANFEEYKMQDAILALLSLKSIRATLVGICYLAFFVVVPHFASQDDPAVIKACAGIAGVVTIPTPDCTMASFNSGSAYLMHQYEQQNVQ